ncbi:MAG: hypothetical protein A2958_02775 [Candidatus Levybacteria bacterium RIFCSPLOWO2_01_FULL_38_13]|nr:MAG: hypothetical protein A2629_03190 [Candidatus Levybacteria bacterium RIFCSPHIGHO2_01_FULL_41_15]OGH35261.1 MAG: hypothetical protein A2958_02775 [Candidatus Levybacteria bacterium RIFCSPLOWO2_01_FULL_38_13]
MKSDINLLAVSQIETVKEDSFLKFLRILSIGFLLLVLFLSILVFILTSRISPSSIVKEQTSIIGRIKLLRNRETKILALNDRIGAVGEILKGRSNYEKTIEVFLSNVPSGVSIGSFEIGKTEIALTARSDSLLDLNAFVKNITDLVKNGKEIKSMTIDNIAFDSRSGTYSLAIKADRL